MIQRFLEYIAIERHYSPRTVESYREDLSEFCEFMSTSLDELDPTQIGEDDVRGWLLWLTEERHQSPRSVHRRLSGLHSYYRYLLRLGLIQRDVTRRVVLPKIAKPLPVFFNPSEVEQATEEQDAADDFRSVRDGLILQMLYQTGMRQQEMLNLSLQNVLTEQGEIRIFGKRNKERIVPIGEGLIQQIQQYMLFRNEVPGSASLEQLFIQPSRQGARPLSKSTLYNIVRTRMGEVSTRKKRSPHVMRHTFATALLNNGADIRSIQSLMGHASLATTQIYTHTTFEQAKQAYQAAHPRSRKNKNQSD